MIKKLSAMQVGVPCKTSNGTNTTAYLTKDTKDRVQIRIGNERVWMDDNDLKRAIIAVFRIDETGVKLS